VTSIPHADAEGTCYTDVSRHLPKPKRYTFEEWVEFVRLIRLTGSKSRYRGDLNDEDEEGLVEWDWIGPDSPLMSGLSESEWLLERLCESLVRLAKKPYVPKRGQELRRGGDWGMGRR
jgi:potassium channel subfamily K